MELVGKRRTVWEVVADMGDYADVIDDIPNKADFAPEYLKANPLPYGADRFAIGLRKRNMLRAAMALCEKQRVTG